MAVFIAYYPKFLRLNPFGHPYKKKVVMRDQKIDLLRCLGLALIILAHVNPPAWLFNLRNFDVPLMVMVSGMSFGLSYKPHEHYATYAWKRIKRLLFPVWIFLCIFFTWQVYGQASTRHYNTDLILPTFLLSHGDSIGYVWIIRVFLLIALTAPFIYRYHLYIRSDLHFLFSLGAGFAVFELMRHLSIAHIWTGWVRYLADITHYLIPYSLLLALGLRLPHLSRNYLVIIGLLSGSIYLCIALYLSSLQGSYVSTNNYKFPPSFYYFSYAIFIVCILWPQLPKATQFLAKWRIMPIIVFVSSNSIWIYLWHILVLAYMNRIGTQNLYLNYCQIWLLVLSLAIIITFMQYRFITRLLAPHISSPMIRKNITQLFTG